ncbi:TonB-dependent receptor [Sphingobium sufflavum]|uniref:TonB-dependent receptor n=1 Tax=Sphingobium sufflavum TaxID=1129547 RepID=UPI001F41EC92|nr:TonB-dependent receptor [Sphingobium sufflavum]MCE7798682.1 TonB-dependent receptor [Sphingobium sufflavum]
MRKRYPYSVLASVSLSALTLFSAPVLAQEAVSDDTIVVTARRTEERLQDVPISITVFNQQQLSNRNVVTAGELATYTPSLQANGRFGAESTSFSLRGFTQEGQTTPSVAVYFADVVAPRAQGGTTGGNGAGVGAFFDLQNVQVLKGPQGTLFGRNTTGGAVLLVPQKPTGRLEGYVEGSVGNYDLRRFQGVVNVPVLDTLRVRLGVDRQTRDGYLNNISGIGPKDFADVDYTAVRLSVVADLTPNLENYTIVNYGESNTNGFYPKVFTQDLIERDAGAALRAAQIASTRGDYYNVSNGLPNPFQKIKQWSLINTTTWRASDTLTIKNIASYAEFRQKQSANIYGENGYQNGVTNPYYAVAIMPAPGFSNTSQSTFTEEVQVQGRTGNDRFNYQVGGYLELSEPLSGFQTSYSPNQINCTDILAFQCNNTGLRSNGNFQISRSKYRFRNLGVYAQGTFKITDTLSITGGIRYTSDVTSGVGAPTKIFFDTPNVPRFACSNPRPVLDDKTAYTSAQIQANPELCKITRRVASSKPTWLIDVDWKPDEDVLIYAKYARGYRQGSVNVSNYGLETWQPEKVDLYEIGLKSSFDGFVRGTFNIAAFYNDFSNQQLAINTVSCGNVANIPGYTTLFPACAGVSPDDFPAPAQGIGNTGKSRIKGIEIDASLTPFEGLKIDVGYAHLDTKVKSIDTIAIPLGFAQLNPATAQLSRGVYVGGPLSLAPRNKYTVTAAYTLPLDESVGRLTFSATFTHQDSAFGSASSIAFLGNPLAGLTSIDNNNEWLPPQNLLNLNINWNGVAGAPVDLGLFVTNVTKERFHTMTTGASFGWDAAILNQPRMWGARLKYRFGS